MRRYAKLLDRYILNDLQLGNLKVKCLLLKVNLNRKLRVRFRLGLINILSASVVIKLV